MSSIFNLFLSFFSPNQLLPWPLCSLKFMTSSVTIIVSLDHCPRVPFHTQAQLRTLSPEVLELYPNNLTTLNAPMSHQLPVKWTYLIFQVSNQHWASERQSSSLHLSDMKTSTKKKKTKLIDHKLGPQTWRCCWQCPKMMVRPNPGQILMKYVRKLLSVN